MGDSNSKYSCESCGFGCVCKVDDPEASPSCDMRTGVVIFGILLFLSVLPIIGGIIVLVGKYCCDSFQSQRDSFRGISWVSGLTDSSAPNPRPCCCCWSAYCCRSRMPRAYLVALVVYAYFGVVATFAICFAIVFTKANSKEEHYESDVSCGSLDGVGIFFLSFTICAYCAAGVIALSVVTMFVGLIHSCYLTALTPELEEGRNEPAGPGESLEEPNAMPSEPSRHVHHEEPIWERNIPMQTRNPTPTHPTGSSDAGDGGEDDASNHLYLEIESSDLDRNHHDLGSGGKDEED